MRLLFLDHCIRPGSLLQWFYDSLQIQKRKVWTVANPGCCAARKCSCCSWDNGKVSWTGNFFWLNVYCIICLFVCLFLFLFSFLLYCNYKGSINLFQLFFSCLYCSLFSLLFVIGKVHVTIIIIFFFTVMVWQPTDHPLITHHKGRQLLILESRCEYIFL